MLQESVYFALYYELNELLSNLQNQALTDEIWLQKSVLNAEMAISEHGRETIVSK